MPPQTLLKMPDKQTNSLSIFATPSYIFFYVHIFNKDLFTDLKKGNRAVSAWFSNNKDDKDNKDLNNLLD